MFSPERALPVEQILNNEYTAMVKTKYGGHISFCEGLLPTGCNYTCRMLTEYLKVVLNDMEEDKLNNNSNLNEQISNAKSDTKPVFTLD